MRWSASMMMKRLPTLLAEFFLNRLQPAELGQLFLRQQIRHAGADPRIGAYALEFNNPQAIRFLMDAYPSIEKLLTKYPRMGEVSLLDIGPAFGAAAGLLSQIHGSHFLGPKLNVSALDIVNDRRAFIEITYPHVHFIHADLFALSENMVWDITFCSNAIEHIAEPEAFIRRVVKHTRGHAVFLAPYNEKDPRSPGHLSRISEVTFNGFSVVESRVIQTSAWPPTADAGTRHQLLVVIAGGYQGS